MRRGIAALAVLSMLSLVAWTARAGVAETSPWGPPEGGAGTPDAGETTHDRSFLYAATGLAYSLLERGPRPRGNAAPFGSFEVEAAGRGVTVEVDDYGTPNGLSVPVRIDVPGQPGFDGCMVVRAPRTFAAVPNARFTVSIGVLNYLCDTRGTVGEAILSGVR